MTSVPAPALANFAAAGLVHFSLGWTLLNLSQKRLGAARTSPLLAATPLFGVVVAAVTLHELPSRHTLAGVALIVGGVYLVELDRLRRAGPAVPIPPDAAVWTASLFGLGTALCWAVSPVLIRRGLQDLPSPLLGVTIGLVAATLAYGLALLRPGGRRLEVSREAIAWKLGAAVLVGVSTWTRWYAVALVPVAVVLGLGLLSVPTVMAAAPLLVGRQAERVTPAVLAGSALVVAGAAVVVTGS